MSDWWLHENKWHYSTLNEFGKGYCPLKVINSLPARLMDVLDILYHTNLYIV